MTEIELQRAQDRVASLERRLRERTNADAVRWAEDFARLLNRMVDLQITSEVNDRYELTQDADMFGLRWTDTNGTVRHADVLWDAAEVRWIVKTYG